MYYSARETVAKWLLLLILLACVASPFVFTFVDAVALPQDVIGQLASVLLVITAFQAAVGIIAWVQLCMERSEGKRLMRRLYIPSLVLYGLYGLFLLLTLLVPDTISYPAELIFVFSHLLVSAVVLALLHVWKRYTF